MNNFVKKFKVYIDKNELHTHYNNMYVIFFILLFILLLFALPFSFKIMFKYSILNYGHIKIKLFGIKLIYYRIKLENNKLILTNFKTEKEIDLKINKQNIDLLNEIKSQIIKRLYLKSISTSIKVGKKDNAFETAIISAIIDVLVKISYSTIKFIKPTSQNSLKLNTYYNRDMGIVNVDVHVYITLTNLLLSFLTAKKTIKGKLYGK